MYYTNREVSDTNLLFFSRRYGETEKEKEGRNPEGKRRNPEGKETRESLWDLEHGGRTCLFGYLYAATSQFTPTIKNICGPLKKKKNTSNGKYSTGIFPLLIRFPSVTFLPSNFPGPITARFFSSALRLLEFI